MLDASDYSNKAWYLDLWDDVIKPQCDEFDEGHPYICLKASCPSPDTQTLYMWSEEKENPEWDGDKENVLYCEHDELTNDDGSMYVLKFENSSIKICDESSPLLFIMYGGQIITEDCWDKDELPLTDGMLSMEGMPIASVELIYDNPATYLELDCSQYGCVIDKVILGKGI